MIERKIMLLRDKIEIVTWLKNCAINKYELIEDDQYGYIVNVKTNVNLNHFNLKKIEVKFNKIIGDFNCGSNNLTSLKGCPEIVYGNFFCMSNKLTSLKYSPKIINKNFGCSYNKLKSLKYSPVKILGSFFCNDNLLINLNDSPEIVQGGFFAANNLLSIESLKYLPEIESNFIDILRNEKLGNLQSINKLTELKEKLNEIFKIKEEKENILEIMNKKNLNNKKINKI